MDRLERANFELGVKAVEVTEDDDGTLYIEGYASDFETDRDGEAFEPGAMDRGLKAYMESNPVILYHHKPDFAMGKAITAALDGKGLRLKAAIPKPAEGGREMAIYTQVKQGILRGFSVGGAFVRRMTANGPRIVDVDLQEISITPLPVNPRTMFALAGKAFNEDADMGSLTRAVDGLDAVLNALEQRVG